MLSRPELKLEAVQRNYIRVRVADGEDLFDLGHFSDEQLNRLHKILDLRLGHSDLGTFEGRVLTDSLHSWSYWSLCFWREH